MAALVIAEHDNATLKGATLNTVTAAIACGGEVHVLIGGHNAGEAAKAAAAGSVKSAPRTPSCKGRACAVCGETRAYGSWSGL